MSSSNQIFSKFAKITAVQMGKPHTLIAAVLIILGWLLTGPIFNYSDTWQLIINTSTTVITFLMVFLIQNTQNRDNEALQLKLDELIRSVNGAHNALLDIEELTQEELDKIKLVYAKLAKKSRDGLREGSIDTDIPDIKFD